MKIAFKKSCLALLAALAIGCGTSSNFFPSAQAQGPLQNLEEPADIVPLDRFVQLDLRVPFPPTVIPSGGNQYVVHELFVQNQIPLDYELVRVEVVDADSNQTVNNLAGSALRQHVRVSGVQEIDETIDDPVPVAAGQSVFVFFFIEFPGDVPRNLKHRLVVNTPSGEVILNHDLVATVDTNPPTVLAPPLSGGPFFCDGAPGFDSYHRRTMLAVDGLARVSQRYAIDFEILTSQGTTFSGDPSVNDNYPIYGQPILASASGTVAKIVDGLPDNTPPEVPNNTDVEKVGGNGVLIDIGDGRYLVHGHMQPGSITVQVGDIITVGQVLGRVGNSGNSFEPHLHLQVCDRPSFLGAQGLPYVFDGYTLINGVTQTPIQNQIPLLNQVISFPGTTSQNAVPQNIVANSHPKCGWH
jgi:peptidase M23-like protein